MIELSSREDKLEIISQVESEIDNLIYEMNNMNYSSYCATISAKLIYIYDLVEDSRQRIINILDRLYFPYLSWLYSFCIIYDFVEIQGIIETSYLHKRIDKEYFIPLLKN